MTFLMKRIREKAHNFVMARFTPLQIELQKAQFQNEINHVQTIQAIEVIARHLHPNLVAQLPTLNNQIGKPMSDIVVAPNYAKLLTPDDVFLLSYPRSGNTWMRAIIAYLLYPPQVLSALSDLDKYVPDLHISLPIHDEYSTPRVLKSHHHYASRHVLDNPDLYSRYIYVIRHPYKVIESYYHFVLSQVGYPLPNLDVFVELIINNAYHYGGWREHVLSWQYAQKYAKSTLFIRYEDLQKNTIAYIKRIATFLGVSIDTDKAEQVKLLSSQENMRELDSKGQILPGFEMVRAGEQRKLDNKLTSTMKSYIYQHYQKEMDDWGYLADGGTLDEYPLKSVYSDDAGRD